MDKKRKKTETQSLIETYNIARRCSWLYLPHLSGSINNFHSHLPVSQPASQPSAFSCRQLNDGACGDGGGGGDGGGDDVEFNRSTRSNNFVAANTITSK